MRTTANTFKISALRHMTLALLPGLSLVLPVNPAYAETYTKVPAVSRSKGGAPDPAITELLKTLQKAVAHQSFATIATTLLSPNFACDPMFPENCDTAWNVKQRALAQLGLARRDEVPYLAEPETITRTYNWTAIRREISAGLGGAIVANPDGSFCTSAEIGYDRRALGDASRRLGVEAFAWRCALDDPVDVFASPKLDSKVGDVKNECIATRDSAPGPRINSTTVTVAAADLSNGTRGFVAVEELSEPAYSGLCLSSENGTWKITSALGDIADGAVEATDTE